MKYILTACKDDRHTPIVLKPSPLSQMSAYISSYEGLDVFNMRDWSRRWCIRIDLAPPYLPMDGIPRRGPPPNLGLGQVIVGNGVVYASSENSYTYAFNASTGALLWQQQTGYANTSAPNLVDDVLYVGSSSISALNAKKGTVEWYHLTQDVVTSSPVVVDGIVYAGSYDGYLYALDAQHGTLRWRFHAGARIYHTPAVINGKVYVGAAEGKNQLYALDAKDGTLLWQKDMQVGASSPLGATSMLYFGSPDAFLYALDAKEGIVRWRSKAGGQVYTNLLLMNEILFCTSSGGVSAFDAGTGQLVWHNTLRANSATRFDSPIPGNEEVYVAVHDERSHFTLYVLDARSGSEQKVIYMDDPIWSMTIA